MKIIFIGAGNVATRMATQLYHKGCCIQQIYSRTLKSAEELATQVEAEAINDLDKISVDADYYIFAVKDSALSEVINQLPTNKGIWLHTAGSIPLDVFSRKTDNYGVVYPLQTFSKNKQIDWGKIPLFIEYSNNDSEKKTRLLAELLSPTIYSLSTEQRKYAHASGVYANNFVNQMYELAFQMIKKVDLPFEILLPIIEETCQKVHQLTPLEAQTGPAIRLDKNVMDKHLQLLDTDADKQLYKLISESIYNSHKTK